VGGIIRDIFTMGARPILNMNSLRFGPIEGDSLEAAQNRRLFAGVVAGIAHYGNCIGVPTVAAKCISMNHMMAIRSSMRFRWAYCATTRSSAAKPQASATPVIYVGSATGRDGLAGAGVRVAGTHGRIASKTGPQFKWAIRSWEKLLLEACLEVMRTDGLVVGIQDMGAAGLTCSTCETASRGGAGNEIDLNLVPKRETA